MGLTAALKLRQIKKNVEHVIAIELVAAAQGIDFHRKELGANTQLGKGTRHIYTHIRKKVPFIEEDTVLYEYLANVEGMVSRGEIYELICKGLYSNP
jgi:histidine ammonia-lyase